MEIPGNSDDNKPKSPSLSLPLVWVEKIFTQNPYSEIQELPSFADGNKSLRVDTFNDPAHLIKGQSLVISFQETVEETKPNTVKVSYSDAQRSSSYELSKLPPLLKDIVEARQTFEQKQDTTQSIQRNELEALYRESLNETQALYQKVIASAEEISVNQLHSETSDPNDPCFSADITVVRKNGEPFAASVTKVTGDSRVFIENYGLTDCAEEVVLHYGQLPQNLLDALNERSTNH